MNEQNKPQRLLRAPEVEARTGLSKTQRFYLMRDGKFPKSIKIGARAVAWIESEIDEYIGRLIAETRDDEQSA